MIETPEDSQLPEQRLERMIDDASLEFEEMKSAIAAGKFTREQCIEIENKLQKLFVELTNEGLRPDKGQSGR
jgi:hypothetical protein